MAKPKKCYRIQVGTGLGLKSKCLTKAEAKKYAKMIEKGGMQVWVV